MTLGQSPVTRHTKQNRPGPHLAFAYTSTTTAMKAILSLLSLASFAIATPVFEQVPLNAKLATYPGFDLDLNAQRLVQMEGQDPVWMTELEKVYTNSYRSS